MADTIYALSSGALPAALGIVRISGTGAQAALARLTPVAPPPRRAVLARLTDPADGSVLDEAILLSFPGPDSVTGEDVVELHCHGGRAVVAGVLEALGRMPGLRLAEPGEFTRRAFIAGRMDLTAVEGLGDLLAAETPQQRQQAQRLIDGGLSRLVDRWQADLLRLAARIEAAIDYAEEGGETEADEAAIRAELAAIADAMASLEHAPPAERLRDGIRVVLAGPPNAGKSTLLNALTGRDAAIVSPQAGTTRDRIEASVIHRGIPYLLTDTAGLRSTDDVIERIGIDRAEEAIDGADIVLWLGQGPAPTITAHVIPLHPKCDDGVGTPGRLAVSVHRPETIERLWQAIGAAAAALVPPTDAISLNRRQRNLIAVAAAAIRNGGRQDDILLVAADVRHALNAFDQLTGRAGVDDMLAALFGQFCVGK